MNVVGKTGWCNQKGTPMWIAFDFGAFFLHAKNIELFNLGKDKCNLRDPAKNINDCLYKGYRRAGRKDMMSMVTLKDVLAGCPSVWYLPFQEYDVPIKTVK